MKEIWKNIKDYEGLYQISNLGRVKSLTRNFIRSNGVKVHWKSRILKNSIDSKNYKYVTLYKNSKKQNHRIHRLLMTAFVKNKHDKPEIDHIDGDRLNNDLNNLRWVTKSENMRNPITLKKQRNRTVSKETRLKISLVHKGKKLSKKQKKQISDRFKGEKHPNSKLKQNDVLTIRKLFKNGLTPSKILLRYNVSLGAIEDICYNKTWKHLLVEGR